MRVRALWFEGPRRVAVREEESSGAPGEIGVRVRLMGISHGTELLAWRGELPPDLPADAVLPAFRGTLRFPLKYGYSSVGVTEDGRRVFGFHPHQDYFTSPPAGLVALPDGIADEDAVFFASMETALSIAHDAAPRFGDAVLVVGLGVVGLLVADVLSRCGARPVAGVDALPLRREAARRAGVMVLDPAEDRTRAALDAMTGGRGVDVAVNVSGSAEGLQLALDAAAFEATVVEASWYGSRRVTLGLGEAFHRKRLRIRSSQVSRIDPALAGRWDKDRRFGTVLSLLAETRPSRLLTHTFALDRAAEAFELIDRHPEECIQVALVP